MERFRVVAEFDSAILYCDHSDNQEILDGMNMALGRLWTNPNFAEERYNANFPDSGIGEYLSE